MTEELRIPMMDEKGKVFQTSYPLVIPTYQEHMRLQETATIGFPVFHHTSEDAKLAMIASTKRQLARIIRDNWEAFISEVNDPNSYLVGATIFEEYTPPKNAFGKDGAVHALAVVYRKTEVAVDQAVDYAQAVAERKAKRDQAIRRYHAQVEHGFFNDGKDVSLQAYLTLGGFEPL